MRKLKRIVATQRIAAIERRLRLAYGAPRHHNPTDPLDDLIFVVLSRMTQELKYLRTYHRVRESLPTWKAVREAPPDHLKALIEEAGLAPTKARHIQGILRTIEEREGRLDLHRLRDLPDSAVEQYLTSLPGVSRKTALCVMMYALDRQVLPVDAHVWRVAQRLGLAPGGPWSERGGRLLEEVVPPRLRRSLHVTIVAHGRAICGATRPACERCALRDICPSRKRRAR